MDHADEYEAAAEWCAKRGFAGREGDPLPPLLSAQVAEEIAADVPAFMSAVRCSAYALAMSRLNLPEE